MILFVDVCRGLKASRWDFSGEDDATPVRMPVAVRWKRSSEWNDHPGIRGSLGTFPSVASNGMDTYHGRLDRLRDR